LTYNSPVSPKFLSAPWLRYLVSLSGIVAATAMLKLPGAPINPTTVALVFVLVVLFVAAAWGSRPAILASLFGVVCFNFFFLPPYGTFTIADPDNWIALFAFLITAVTAGQLSAHARRRAEEAVAARREIERLYYELQDTFERSAQAKALKQSERLKSALLDAVTHDLRTPLTSIKASVTTLIEEFRSQTSGENAGRLDDESRKDMLAVINEEADRLDHFIEGLTKLARIEAGELQLRRHWSSMGEIIRTALKRAEPRTREHQIDVTIEDELPAVRVDEHAVAEVVYTLLDNAAKYSPPGSAVRVSARSNDDETVRLVIEDHGPGIPVELRERVFDKFFRAMRDGDARGQKSAGSGMGLAIAKGIVEAHGGRIWIEDSADQPGTKFIVALPTGDEDGARLSSQLIGQTREEWP